MDLDQLDNFRDSWKIKEGLAYIGNEDTPLWLYCGVLFIELESILLKKISPEENPVLQKFLLIAQEADTLAAIRAIAMLWELKLFNTVTIPVFELLMQQENDLSGTEIKRDKKQIAGYISNMIFCENPENQAHIDWHTGVKKEKTQEVDMTDYYFKWD